MYHLPILPGYGPNSNIRSSAPSTTRTGKSFLAHLSEAEENGYQGTYFPSEVARSPTSLREGYISSNSPVLARNARLPNIDKPEPVEETDVEADPGFMTEPEVETVASEDTTEPNHTPDIDPGAETDPGFYGRWTPKAAAAKLEPEALRKDEDVAEVVFFEYGVVVFFGLEERQEKDILEDIDNAGVVRRKLDEDDWEIEECHFTVCRCERPWHWTVLNPLPSTIHTSRIHASIMTSLVCLPLSPGTRAN